MLLTETDANTRNDRSQLVNMLVANKDLESAILEANAITDTEGLRGSRLQSLNLANTKVVNVNTLQPMPLRKLVLDNTPVSNLAPLKGTPLDFLSLEGIVAVHRPLF